MSSEPGVSIQAPLDLPRHFVRTSIPMYYNQPQFPKKDLCAKSGHQDCRGRALDRDANILVQLLVSSG